MFVPSLSWQNYRVPHPKMSSNLPNGRVFWGGGADLHVGADPASVGSGGGDGKSKFLVAKLRVMGRVDAEPEPEPEPEVVVVATCHLDSRKDATGAETRARQTERLLAEVDGVAAAEGAEGGGGQAAAAAAAAAAVFICGDLNAQRGERCHDMILNHHLPGQQQQRQQQRRQQQHSKQHGAAAAASDDDGIGLRDVMADAGTNKTAPPLPFADLDLLV
jgi:hypothetical protein